MDLSFLPDQNTKEDDEVFEQSQYSEKEISQIVTKQFHKMIKRETYRFSNIDDFMGGD